MGRGSLIRYALRAFSLPPLLMTAVVSVLAAIAAAGGWFAITLDVILVTWTWSYTYTLIEHTAHGSPVPVLSVEMTNPWHEPRPLLQVVLFLGVASLVYWLWGRGDRELAAGIALAALVLAPASLAVLAVEGSPIRALWPPALIAVARGIGWRYLAILFAAGVAAVALVEIAPQLPRVLLYAFVQIVFYAFASVLGGALFERRHELGLEASDAPERAEARRDAAAERVRDRAADEVYSLARVNQRANALRALESALGPPPVDPAAYLWFRERASRWQERWVADWLTGELVARLIALGRRGEALHEVEGWWRQGGEFRPRAPRDLDVLKSVAADLGHAATRERLSQLEPAGSPASR